MISKKQDGKDLFLQGKYLGAARRLKQQNDLCNAAMETVGIIKQTATRIYDKLLARKRLGAIIPLDEVAQIDMELNSMQGDLNTVLAAYPNAKKTCDEVREILLKIWYLLHGTGRFSPERYKEIVR